MELAEAVIEFLRPFQTKMTEISDEELNRILKIGAEKAKSVAGKTLSDVYQKLGLK